MADIQLLLEAERRGLLPPDKVALLTEARNRGLLGDSQTSGRPSPLVGEASTSQAPAKDPSLLERFLAKNPIANQVVSDAKRLGDAGYGALRGVKDVIDTGADVLSNLGGSEENARIKAMNQAGKDQFSTEYGDNSDASVGRFLGNVAATAPIGGVLAKGAMVAGSRLAPTVAPMVAEALRTGGMSTGAPAARALSMEGVRNAAIRIGGGATSAAAMQGMIDPEHIGTAAMLGGALPGAAKVAGKVGSSIGKSMTASPAVAQLAQKAKALGIDIPADRLANSKMLDATAASLNYVPFSGRIATETKMNNQIKKALSNTFGEDTEHLSKDLFSKTQAKLGQGFDDFLTKNNLVVDRQLKSELYKKLELAKREMGNDARFKSLKNQVDDLFEKAYSQQVSTAAQSMDDISRINAARQSHPDMVVGGAPADMPTGQAKDLLGEIRKLGGVSMRDAKDLLGERQITKMGVQGGVFTTNGEQVGDMVRRLVDKGVMPRQALDDVDGGAQALRDAIQQAASGGGDDMAQRAAAEAYYGAPEVLPGAFKEGVSASSQSVPFEKSNTIYGAAAYDTKKVLDRMSRSIDTSLSHHAKEIRDSIMDGVLRSAPPDEAAAFIALKRKYANLKSLQKLANNSAEGDISMARLGNLDSKNPEVSDIAKIAATFAKGRESPHGAMQRVTIGGGVTALGGGLAAGVAAPVAVGLTGGRLANMALNSNAVKKMILAQPNGKNKLSELLKNPAIRALPIAAQSR